MTDATGSGPPLPPEPRSAGDPAVPEAPGTEAVTRAEVPSPSPADTPEPLLPEPPAAGAPAAGAPAAEALPPPALAADAPAVFATPTEDLAPAADEPPGADRTTAASVPAAASAAADAAAITPADSIGDTVLPGVPLTSSAVPAVAPAAGPEAGPADGPAAGIAAGVAASAATDEAPASGASPASGTGSARDGRHAAPSTRRPRRWLRVVTALASVLVLLVAATGAAAALVYNHLGSNITALDISDQVGSERPIRPVVDEGGNYSAVNILLMGSDTRQGSDNRGYGNASIITGQRSDTTILLHLSADRTRALAVSIPRDTWVTLPECKNRETGETVGGYENKFNVAFEIGGPGCTVKLVEQMTGVSVDHFMVIDFGGFKRVIDAMGGVEVCLTKAVNDDKSGLVLPAGKSVVQGEQALAFVRARKTLGDGSDLSRIQRQQQFLSSLIRKASSTEMLLNPVSLYQVLDAATKSLTADPELADIDNLRDLALSVRSMKPSQISFVTLPWVPRGDNANVLVDTERIGPIVDAINADTPWPPKRTGGQPRLTRAPEQISVRVLNGTSRPGLAKKAAAALEAEGYTVVEVANADTSDYATSVVRYDPGWDESAKTVTWAVSGATSEPEDGLGNVITVVIGADYTKIRPAVISAGTSGGEASATTADEVVCSS